MTYVAGFNLPGYLPEAEPLTFDDFQDARNYIASEIRQAWDDAYESVGDDADLRLEVDSKFLEAETDVIYKSGPFEVEADDYVYWVMPAQD